MSRNIIFCFSGTGNCLDLAQNIARGIGDTDIVMMRSEPVVKDVSGAETVGFVFPCYGGGAPADFLKYVRQLIISRSSYIYGISQSASYAGTGLYALNRLVPLDYWRTVTHQCSCIWLFPHTMMMPPMDAEKAQARSEMLACEIAGEILERKRLKKSLHAIS